MKVSFKIANRASTGQNWGLSLSSSGTAESNSNSSGVGRGRAQCQLARRLISDKLDAHSRLLDVLLETVSQTHSLCEYSI